MLNLSQIYAKLSTLFKFRDRKISKNKDIPNNSIEYIASLSLGLLNNDYDTVDIKCLLPDVDNKSIEEISNIAEKYAQLLVLLHTEAFDKNIFRILDNNKILYKDNYKSTLLIDNIISFWKILYQLESKKYHQKFKMNQPLIKPSEAFKVK